MWRFRSDVAKMRKNRDVRGLIRLLRSDDRDIRWIAVAALGEIRDPDSAGDLISALKDEDYLVGLQARGSLVSIGEGASIALVRSLKDHNADIRAGSSGALGDMKCVSAVPDIIQTLNDDNDKVRWYSAIALGDIGSIEAVAPLVTLLDDRDKAVREATAAALEKILGASCAVQAGELQPQVRLSRELAEHALTQFRDSLRDSSERHASGSGTEKIGSDGVGKGATREQGSNAEVLVRYLSESLRDTSVFARLRAVESLSNVAEPECVAPLVTALHDDFFIVRNSASRALGKIGSPAIDMIRNATLDANYNVRYLAVLALGIIQDDGVIPAIIERLADEDSFVRYCSAEVLSLRADARAIPPLVELLRDEDLNVRECAARALGTQGSAVSVSALISALSDDSEFVRVSILKSLGTIPDNRCVKPLVDNLMAPLMSEVAEISLRSLLQCAVNLLDDASLRSVASLSDDYPCVICPGIDSDLTVDCRRIKNLAQHLLANRSG